MTSARNTHLKERRGPLSPRSKSTVDCILQSTKELLERGGYAALTTNHIAERAGVNINSVYQYFSNKEAIAVQLFENTAFQAANALRQESLSLGQRNIEASLKKLIGALLAIYKENAAVLLRLPQELPVLEKSAYALEMENLLQAAGRYFIERFRHELPRRKLELAYYIIAHGVMGCVRSHILHPSANISDRQLVNEMSRYVAVNVDILK